ncbi:MAG: sensor histidine kinase [Deltaproteobacteria bacterium]
MVHEMNSDEQLGALASHLHARRAAILQRWRAAIDVDAELTTASALSRAQFYDHIPEVLDAFERKLSAQQRREEVAAERDQKESAVGHGLQRWHQGYRQREVMREWGHLHLCLVDELESYTVANPGLEVDVMPTARRALAQLCSDGVCESAAQYARLEQIEASGRVRDLESALEQLNELERRRLELWREAAHDLRGNLGAVKSATAVLNHEQVSEPIRAKIVTLLQTGVAALQTLLDDLMTLARLEAGHEQRKLQRFDVAATLKALCKNMEPFAAERGLFLKAEGPDTLRVEGDGAKIQRIAQNLLLNALKYTERGGVKVTWEDSATVDQERWALCVKDTGPGFQDASVPPLARALKVATEEAQSVEEKAEEAGDAAAQAEAAPTLPSQSTHRRDNQPTGEGIGLSIVKRLCDLLDASLELATEPGQGSTFRVIFPRRY